MVIWRRIALVALLAFAFAPILFLSRSEWVTEDSTAYQGLADSLRSGRYELNYQPFVVYPPGFPIVLSVWGASATASHARYLVLIALLSFAGLIAAWRAQRIDAGETAALTACLLLACAPQYVRLISRNVCSETLYLLVSCLAILCARRLDYAQAPWRYGLALTVLTPGVVLVRAAGASWVTGLFFWLALSVWIDRQEAARRARLAGPALVAGVLALVGWNVWCFAHQPTAEFKGQPHSYLDLAVYRNPLDTDQGNIGIAELPVRWLEQAATDADSALSLLVGPIWISPTFYSVPVAAFFFLCGLGLATFVRQRGIQAVDCYFVCYWLVLAAWPFAAASRYVMPILPFCIAYGWRGLGAFYVQRVDGAAVRLLGVFAALMAAGGLFSLICHHTLAGKQNLFSVVFWAVCAAGCWIGRNWNRSMIVLARPVRVLALSIAAGLAINGAVESLAIARANLASSEGSIAGGRFAGSGFALAARQIAASSRPSDVAMADFCYIVYGWSQRRCVRFPPTRNVSLIVETIRKYQVSWLVVGTESQPSCYQPPDWQRVRSLEAVAPGLLRLAQETAEYRIYEVEGAPLSGVSPMFPPTAAQGGVQ